MFVDDLTDPLQHKLIEPFIFLSDSNGEVKDDGILEYFSLNGEVEFVAFCQHSQQIPCVFS